MNRLEPPQSFPFEGNVSQGWKLWLKYFEFYLTATEKDRKNDKAKSSVLLSCIGQKGKEIYETFHFNNPVDKMRLVLVLEKLSNITLLHHKFFTYRHYEGQNFNDFVTEL